MNNTEKIKIAIIGGKGFVGRNLSEILDQEHIEYGIFDKYCGNCDENSFDINSFDDFEKLKDYNIWINLAAVHRDDEPLHLYDLVNVEGAKNLCKAANHYGIKKIIFTSSVAIYGFAPEGTDESGQPNYFNDYGRTKYLAEKVYLDWFSEDEKNKMLTIIRPTVIFGEGNRGNVYNLLNQIASNRFVMIGNGKNIKSMAYVKNVAAFINHCVHFKNKLHIYNYIDKPDMDMNKLVSKTREILFAKRNIGIRLPSFIGFFIGKLADLISIIVKVKLPISSIRVEKFMKTTSFNSSFDKTGFKPPYSLEEALEQTIKYEFIDSDKGL